jgi:hypothetical protein
MEIVFNTPGTDLKVSEFVEAGDGSRVLPYQELTCE